jgi:hypothetical protein
VTADDVTVKAQDNATLHDVVADVNSIDIEATTGNVNLLQGTLGTVNAVNAVTVLAGQTITTALGTNVLAGDDVTFKAGTDVTLNGTIGAVTAIGGDVDLAAGNDINVKGAVTGARNISYTAGADVNLDALTTATTNGDVIIKAASDVLATAKGDVTATGTGAIRVTATTGEITMADGTVFNADTGVIGMTANGNVTLGQVMTTNATENAVSITSQNAGIIDGGDTGGSDIIADAAGAVTTLRAATGIGNTNPLETTINALDARNTTSGNIEIAESNALEVFQARQDAAGNVNITSIGNLTVSAGQRGVGTTSGAILLFALGASDLAVNAPVTSTSGGITLQANDDVNFSPAGDVRSTSGNVSVTADADDSNTGGLVTMANGTVINAGSGTVTVKAYGDVALGQIVTTNSTISAVDILSEDGAVTDANGEDLNVIANGGRLVITANTGVGSADALETKVGSLDIVNNKSGNIQIEEVDAVTIVQALQVAPGVGNIRIIAGGTMTVDDGLAAHNTIVGTQGTGTVTLAAKGSASDLVLNDGIATATGNITVAADNDITMGAGGDITSISGNVAVVADADAHLVGAGGKLTMADGSLVNAGSGTITVSADGNVILGGLLTTNATANAVSVISTSGSILDGGDTHVEITALTGTVKMRAATGIGNVIPPGSPAANAALEMAAPDITGDTTTGVIGINNNLATAVIVRSLTTGSGNITFNQTGGGDVTFTLVKTGAGSVFLTNTDVATSPSIIVGDVTATNLADIRAKGSIFNDGIAGTDITAPLANLVATNGTIGVWGMPVEVDVSRTLYVNAGGMQNRWLSANLQGREVLALVTDLAIPGLVLFNDANLGESLNNGTFYYFDNRMSNLFLQAIGQNKMEVANDLRPFEVDLDVYGDAIFAPFEDLFSFLGAGVSREAEEDNLRLRR